MVYKNLKFINFYVEGRPFIIHIPKKVSKESKQMFKAIKPAIVESILFFIL